MVGTLGGTKLSKSKQKGTAAETAVVRYLQQNGYPNVERRALNGTQDRGDVSGIADVVIEVKNHARMELSEWVKELEAEIKNAQATSGTVIHKKRGTTNVGEWYATLPVELWVQLIQRAKY